MLFPSIPQLPSPPKARNCRLEAMYLATVTSLLLTSWKDSIPFFFVYVTSPMSTIVLLICHLFPSTMLLHSLVNMAFYCVCVSTTSNKNGCYLLQCDITSKMFLFQHFEGTDSECSGSPISIKVHAIITSSQRKYYICTFTFLLAAQEQEPLFLRMKRGAAPSNWLYCIYCSQW